MPSCTASPGANLLNRTYTAAGGALNWTQFAYNYTAISTMPLLVFAFANGGSDYSYLDNVSVVDNNAPSIQLLNNPGFENSTSNLTGWTAWCATTGNCGAGNTGQVLTNSTCYSGNCYMDHCHNNYDFLAQSFLATMGDTYTISFWLKQTGTTTLKFYANIETWRVLSPSQRWDRQIQNILTTKHDFISFFSFDFTWCTYSKLFADLNF